MNFKKNKYRVALSSLLFFNVELPDNLQKFNGLPSDSNKVFILKCLIKTNKKFVKGDIPNGLIYANIAVVDGLQFLEASDPHFK